MYLNSDWKKLLKEDMASPYFLQLRQFLTNERAQNKVIYPENKNIFNCLNSTPFNDVKVVIIGQDPYHGENQAHGLSFSVKPTVKVPPSLRNIYKELAEDLNCPVPDSGNLQAWANQGVLLLNNTLTVEQSLPAGHKNIGWEKFTDKIIELLNTQRLHLVFILWGSPAQKKASKVDSSKHLILKAPHPSPLSCYRGFFGGKYFSKTNEYLTSKHIKPINWEKL
jgi:uracil-DNA glycosylase